MTQRISAAEYRAMQENLGKRKNKYNAKKAELDGKTYDSQHEANRAAELKMLQKAGRVRLVFEQVPLELPGGIKYVADFVILWANGTWTVEDAKGYRTDVYKLKKKLVWSEYGIDILEV